MEPLKQVQYKIGDLLLVNIGFLQEQEVTNISQETKAIKLDTMWYNVSDINSKILGKIGTVTYKKSLLGLSEKRIVEYLNGK